MDGIVSGTAGWITSVLDVLPPQMRDPVLFAVPFFLLPLILEWTAARKLEELEPDSRPVSGAYLRRDACASISMGLVSVATTAVWKLLALLGYAAIYTYLAPWHLPATQWYTWVIAIVGVDLLFYTYHRIAHQVRLIWATHQAHHSSEYFNFATALRQKWNNSGEILMWIPLPLLGVPPWMVFAAFSLNLIYQFWVHTERIDKLWGPFEFVFSTPLTKPVNTFNIWTLQTREYVAIAHDVRAANGWRQRLGYIFGPPGWEPKRNLRSEPRTTASASQ